MHFFYLEEALGIGSKFLINIGNTEMKLPTAYSRNTSSPLGNQQFAVELGVAENSEGKIQKIWCSPSLIYMENMQPNACRETSPDFSSLGQICNASWNLSWWGWEVSDV